MSLSQRDLREYKMMGIKCSLGCFGLAIIAALGAVFFKSEIGRACDVVAAMYCVFQGTRIALRTRADLKEWS